MRYLTLVGNTYHYRRRIPDDLRSLLGKDWWKQSLRTSDEREAERRARSLAVEHDREIEELRSGREPFLLMRAKRAETIALEKLASIDLRDGEQSTGKGQLDQLFSSAMLAHDRRLHFAARIDADAAIAARARLGSLTQRERDLLAGYAGLPSFHESVRKQRVAFDLQRRFSAAQGEITIQKEAELRVQLERLQELEKILYKLGLDTSHISSDPGNPTVTIARDAWFAERNQGAIAQKRHSVALRRFIEMQGDLPVRSITRDMAYAYKEAIANLTDHRHLPASVRGSLETRAGLPVVCSKTVERHLITLKAFFTYCVERGWVGSNVASGLKAPRDTRPKSIKRRHFNREERCALLAQAIREYGEDSDKAWLIRLSAYTGCRLEELAQLSRKNIRQIEGIWVIEIDDLDGRVLKTPSSVRCVPLHVAIREPLLKWLCGSQDDQVFQSFSRKNGRFSSKLSGEMARLMDRAGLDQPQLVMHSFRHGLKVAMAEAGLDGDIRRLILGHAPRDTHDMYQRLSVAALAKAFDGMPSLF